MKLRSLEATRQAYADVLDGDSSPELLRLIRDLDAGYSAVEPPHWVRRVVTVRGGTWPRRPVGDRGRAWWFKRGRSLAPVLAVTMGVLVFVASVTVAGSDITRLGPPTQDVPSNSYFPLSGFRHVPHLMLRDHRKAELLWIGTLWMRDILSGSERWPVVKALTQFGSFRGMLPVDRQCYTTYKSINGTYPVCYRPTYDWSHATYSSKYVGFVHRDILNNAGRTFQSLSPTETALYDRYIKRKTGKSADAYSTAVTSDYSTEVLRTFPLLAVSGYVQTVTQDPLTAALGTESYLPKTDMAASPDALTFDMVRNTLVTGTGLHPQTLLSMTNAEANVITALICHADGMQPKSVCRRAVVKRLLKYVR